MANPVSQYVFRHSDKFMFYPFAVCDGGLMLKDTFVRLTTNPAVEAVSPLAMSLDSLSGLAFIGSTVALKYSKSHPSIAFRANALCIYAAIGSLMASGFGMDPFSSNPVDIGKVWSAVGFIPGATLTLFEDEIGRAATYLRARSNNAVSKLLTSVSRFPLIWTAGMNVVSTLGILGSGLADPVREWPLVPVAIAAFMGNAALMAADRRLAGLGAYAKFWHDRVHTPKLTAA